MSETRLRPLIVPIFIPNLGCPHRCAFCEQKRITSQSRKTIRADEVVRVIESAVRSKGYDRRRLPEVAFYGGTFTMLPLELMKELLGAVKPYLGQGFFRSIRISTRPDAVDDERLELLRVYGVDTVELGVQSMQDDVLRLSRRGHTAEDTRLAVGALRRYGFKVGIQLMPGLPGDSAEKFHQTVNRVISLRPDVARIYPAVVIKGTALAQWYREGRYVPLGITEAVVLCAEGCMQLETTGIPVIRIGLMSSPSLLEEGQILAGPWHPAFGFIVRSALHHERIAHHLPSLGHGGKIRIFAPGREIPLIRGYKNQGLRKIERVTGASAVEVRPDDTIPPGKIAVEIEAC